MKRILVLMGLAAACSAPPGDHVELSPAVGEPSTAPLARRDELAPSEPPDAHVFHARGASSGSSGSPLMTWHGGPVLHSAVTEAIFWGTSWSSAAFTGDKITGIDAFYAGFGGSNYAATSNEYTDASGAVTSNVAYAGHVVDTSGVPKRASRSTSILVNRVCADVASPTPNAFYAVYTDLPRGGASFCAWHASGTCANGTPIEVGFFFELDGDAGCDPQSTVSGESQGLAALANVSAHELSETRTDPRINAWYDASGSENGDKCAWAFQLPSVTFTNGWQWKLQGEWSNAAYEAGTGFPNQQGQTGCLQGGP